jgi:hypothetical protein
VDSIISIQDQAEVRISEMGDKVKKILHTDNHKKNTYDYNIHELWDMIKRPNLRIHKVG